MKLLIRARHSFWHFYSYSLIYFNSHSNTAWCFLLFPFYWWSHCRELSILSKVIQINSRRKVIGSSIQGNHLSVKNQVTLCAKHNSHHCCHLHYRCHELHHYLPSTYLFSPGQFVKCFCIILPGSSQFCVAGKPNVITPILQIKKIIDSRASVTSLSGRVGTQLQLSSLQSCPRCLWKRMPGRMGVGPWDSAAMTILVDQLSKEQEKLSCCTSLGMLTVRQITASATEKQHR